MEKLVANITGKVRRETMGGRQYLVAPTTLIVPGVLNGSKGPLYYPEEEIGKNPSAWNGVPIVVYHPKRSGEAISARDPEVLNSQGIGFVFRSSANGKLKAEAWLDEENTRKVDNRILESIEEGKSIPLSTGLFTDNEPAAEGATFNGESYDFIARNYRPDHLAILPDQQGACSLEDGCGVLVNKAKGNKEVDMAKKELIDTLINNCSCWAEEDRETLNGFEDSKVQTLIDGAKKSKEQELIANAAKKGFTDKQGDFHQYDESEGKWDHKVAQKPTENSTKSTNKSPETPKTEEQWMQDAPPKIRSMVQNVMRHEEEARHQMIDGIVANMEKDEQDSMRDWLMEVDFDKLEKIAATSKSKEEPTSNQVGRIASYLGRTGSAPISNRAKKQYEPLPPLTINRIEEMEKAKSV